MLIFPFSIRKIKNKLQSINPDAIIVTSFLSAYFAMYWRKFFSKEYKIYGVLVDYYPSSIWYISIDKIFVANNLSKKILEQNIGNSTSIHITGIPIPIRNTKPIIPLNQRKEILLTGGGWGLGPILEVTKVLLSIDQISKINVICGDNLLLKTQLETFFRKDIQNNRLRVVGFVSDIEEYYKHARIIISKAGGITLTEVAGFEVPMIITSVITGSEAENRKYFANAESCEIANTAEELKNKVIELLNDEEKSNKLIQNAKRLIYPEPSHAIAKIISEDLSNGD
jgi:UDP-N-acetylglucosamine:LPS N-acetylglucosamine transferase